MDYRSNITQSPTFCPAPWTSLNINQIGLVLPCMCSSFELGNIKQKNIKEILKDEPLKSLKQAQIDGCWHTACTECEMREKYNTSPRSTWRIEADTVEKIQQDIDNFFQPEHITVNWSNLCNLACTYCNDQTSTAWQSYNKIPISYIRNEHDALIELVKENTGTLRGLTLGGGEPLLQKRLVDFLQALDPQTVSVLVTTNLSVDLSTNEIYQILKTWPNVSWMISFDNVNKQQFEYVRHGANWDVFCNNIDIMKKDNQNVLAHPAYSIYCALNLEEYYAFCVEKQLDLFWCDLIDPLPLDARRQNKKIRDRAIVEIQQVTERYKGKLGGSFETLERYRTQLEDPSYLRPIGETEACLRTFSTDIEKKLNKNNTFAELWPQVWGLLD